jgi:hypothetical protein
MSKIDPLAFTGLPVTFKRWLRVFDDEGKPFFRRVYGDPDNFERVTGIECHPDAMPHILKIMNNQQQKVNQP